ncbi:MAG: hypothetical protein MZV70_50200 [Desulfobacterales bacterium]|nr:hypothetical protein [Desulfobacterales bacterium]
MLRGIYRGRDKSTDENQFFFHWDYLNETAARSAIPGGPTRSASIVIEIAHARPGAGGGRGRGRRCSRTPWPRP